MYIYQYVCRYLYRYLCVSGYLYQYIIMAMVTDSNQPPSNMNTNTSVEVMRFEPFASAVDVAFWMQTNAKKLDVWRLDETPYPLKASYAPCARAGEIAAPLQVAEGALESSERAGRPPRRSAIWRKAYRGSIDGYISGR